ncbi:hypothetical protein Trydic_g19168 [Trypoxylus dichotomus]
MPKNENSSQFEILPHENNIEYTREGGYFVTYKKALIYLFITLSFSAVVGFLVYRYGPNNAWQQADATQENIQDLLDKSIRNQPVQSLRLSGDVKPLNYKLKIQPNIDNLTFSGEINFVCITSQSTNFIVNVQEELLFNNKSATPLSTTPDDVHIEKIFHGVKHGNAKVFDHIHVIARKMIKDNEQYRLHLSNALTPGNKYLLTITYDGNISQSLQGLHENSYVTSEGEKKYIIASHLQPVFARRVFPCFDEPSMQATFEITIVHKDNMTSLSNMPLQNSTDIGNGWIEDQFQITPPMPTFLVAIVLLDKQYYSSITGNQNVSIWAPKEHLKYVSYSLEKTERILTYYSKHFDLEYALPKLDIVTIPTLPSTATENWGLILFKESTLLSGEDERETFSFLAKKIAQQWFGNLVSINWWNDLWLVKGFALLEADEASVEVNNWNSDFTLRIMQSIFGLDDFLEITLDPNITNILQINQLYDSITHFKGSCLLRMLENSMPEILFQNGTQNFLKKWKYETVSQKDFWNSINDLAEDYLPAQINISDIMETWSSQSGYPLITVLRNETTQSLQVNQSKFQAINDSDSSLWIVPLNYVIGNGDERKLWLTNRSITVANVSSDKWVLFNVKRTGYYRVNYDNNSWNQLIQVLKMNHEVIPPENRGQLINDAFKLAENGLISYEIPFNLTKYLHKEERYIPWASVLDSLEFLKDALQSTYLNGAYEQYIKYLVSPLYDKMWNVTDGHQLLRRLTIETACNVNYEPCTAWAEKLFDEWMKKNISVPNDLRKTIFCTAIRTGSEEEWDFLWNQIKLQKTNSDIEQLFMSLGCTRDTWLINKYMRNAQSGAIPWQYVPYVWKSLGQPTSLAFGFQYLRENWDTIYQAYKDKPIILKAIVQDFLFKLGTKSDLEDLTILVKKHEEDFQQLATLVQGVVDRIKARVEWSNKHLHEIEELLLG